ncbi:MAG TPA: ABC transporter ATP-binding protein [Myxococcales bacterium]|nr:ABC transporter ATP-binding protein [Myxococcales bacterium]
MSGAPVIRLERVGKVYRMGDVEVPALRDVTLSIDQGEFVAIMGASGSGKSTLMNLIGCLDRPSAGRYFLGGREVSRLSRNELAEIRNRLIGFVFQQFNLLARTSALENVELPLLYADVPARERQRRAAEALRRVGLGERMDHTPSRLSGGQQQRVAIARALVNDPKVLLADEPTGALDSRTSAEVMQLFRDLGRSGIIVVYVTHEPDIAAWAERVVRIKDGSIVADERTPRGKEALG